MPPRLVRIVTCVCVSLWHAPLPWLHCHGSPEAGEHRELLRQHANRWHVGDATDEDGWHLHFAMLDDIVRGGGCPVPPDEDGDDQQPASPDVVSGPLFESAIEWVMSSARLGVSGPGIPLATPVGRRSLDSLNRNADKSSGHRRLLTVLCISVR